MCLVNKYTLLSRDEFPKINGIAIRGIYPYKLKHNGSTHIFSGTPDYWRLVPLGRKDKDIKLKALPEPFYSILGKGDMSTHMSYREHDSANGSFTDETVSLVLGERNYLNFYRAEPYMDKYDCTIKKDSKLGKLILSTIGLDIKVDVLDDSYGVWYEQTYIERVGSVWYPDVAQESWRWLHGMPYVSNNYLDNTHIRVLNRKLGIQYYMERIEPKKDMDNLVIINFPNNSDKRGYEFCNPITWSERKLEDPNGLVRYRILHIKRDGSIQVAAILNDKIQFKEWRNGYFYIVHRIITN